MLGFLGSTSKSATRPVTSAGPMLRNSSPSKVAAFSRSLFGAWPEGTTTAATSAAAERTKVSRCFIEMLLGQGTARPILTHSHSEKWQPCDLMTHLDPGLVPLHP